MQGSRVESSARLALGALVEEELFRPVPPAAQRFATEIRRRHGDAVAAVVFYGSCLRKDSPEGVLDFYVIVDAYDRAYRSRGLAWANALLPPNVFYVELEHSPEPLRAKYAVLSWRDFARGAAPGGLRSGVWARFCQPCLAAYVRDAGSREALVRETSQAVRTAVRQVLPLLPALGGTQRFDARGFWQSAFRETYAAEMRPESAEAVKGLYDASPARFASALRGALDALQDQGWLCWRETEAGLEVEQPEGRLRRARRTWWLRRPAAKLAYLLQLGKSALTFGDFLPYALWKLERHSGTRLVPSERQRRHPFVFGWPLLLRALWRRDLR